MSVDDEIVSITFDNATFEKRLEKTLASLDKLSESLKFNGAQKGFNTISDAANRFDVSRMASALDNISSKFSALGVVGFTVIQHLTEGVIGFAKDVADKVLGPIEEGGKRRAENIEQAKFQFRGLGIDVDKAMSSALDAVRGTAYGLDEASKAAAQLGASGIQAGSQMTGILRGIAGAAAMTNTSFSEMADIFTSSAGTGFINNQDLGQFATRGLNAAAAIAPILHKTEAQIHEMASNGELDFKTFADAMDKAFGAHATQANETYSGSLANMHAAMSRLGASFFTGKMEHQRDLFNALTPVIDNVTKALQPLIGLVLEADRISTAGIISFLKGIDLTNFSNAITIVSRALGNIFNFLTIIKQQFVGAFRDIFPESNISILVYLAHALETFSEKLKMSWDTMDKVRSVFQGFFAILDIGWEVIKLTFLLLKDLFGVFDGAGGGILNFGAGLGNALVSLDKFLVQGGALKRFFEAFAYYIHKPVELIQELRDKIVEFFQSLTTLKAPDAVTNAVDRIGERFSLLETILARVGQGLGAVGFVIYKALSWIGTQIKNFFSELLEPGDFDNAVDAVNVGLLAGIALLIKKFLSGGIDVNLFSGLVDKIKGTFDQLTTTLSAMQTNLKATALLKIAGAVGILTASVLVLSTIDSEKLTKAMVGMAVGFGQLVGVMTLMDKSIGSARSATKVGILATALIGLSTAMLILSAAVKNLSGLNWNELAKGLSGVGVGLGILVTSTRLIAEDTSGLIRAGIAIGAISAAMYILAQAVQAFATLSWGDLAKGLAGVAGGLGLILGAMQLMPTGSTLAAGAAMIPLATGLTILAGAVKLFSMMSWGEMAKGMVGIGGGLLIIAGAMQLMPISMPVTAAGLVLVAGAMVIMAGAINLMGAMKLGDLTKGIGALAAVMGILAVALNVMTGTAAGSASLLIASGALVVLTGVLFGLSQLSIAEIATGIITIAAALGVIGGAAMLLTPAIPEMLGMGAALALIGGGFALFGAGALMIAKALGIIADTGKDAAKAILGIVEVFVTARIQIVRALVDSIVLFAEDILNAAPVLIKGIKILLLKLLDAIIEIAPKLAKALLAIFTEGLKLLRTIYPDMVQTGFELLIGFLQGIRDNIGEITKLVADIVINFLDAFSEKVPEVVDSLFNLFMTIITSVARKLGESATAFIPVGQAFLDGLISGLTTNLVNLLKWFIELPGKILGIIKDAFGINSPSTVFMQIGVDLITGLFNGLVDTVEKVMSWFIELPGKILGWLGDLATTLIPKGWDLLVGFFTGLGNKERELITWFAGLGGKVVGWIGDMLGKLVQKGVDLLQGLWNGAISLMQDIKDWAGQIGLHILHAIGDLSKILLDAGKKLLHGLWDGMKEAWKDITGWIGKLAGWMKSLKGPPSYDAVVLMGNGQLIMQGLWIGMKDGWDNVTKWLSSLNPADHIADKVTQGLSIALGQIPNALAGIGEFNPVITPVLDLTKVQQASKGLDGLMRVSAISPDVSYERARFIAKTTDLETGGTDTPVYTGPSEITFEQNIYSPEALSVGDIYRNTKSQIAMAKEELDIP